jgi:hypothetical protein
MGTPKDPAYELNLTYELLDEFMVDEDGNVDEEKPRWISETVPFFSLEADRAKSTKRYLALDADVAHDGDWTQLLGTPCLVTIVQNPGKGKNAGRVFNNVAEIAPMRPRQAETAPPLVNEAFSFDVDEPDLDVFNKLPDFLKDKITGNLEFNGSALQEALGETANDSEPEVTEGEDPDGSF